MSAHTLVDAERLRAEVRDEYRAVAAEPAAAYHFHTGRTLAARLGYDTGLVDGFPDVAVESFAGVAEMLAKSRATAGALGLTHVGFRNGLAEQLPVPDGWAGAVMSNGVINLCADKWAVFAEMFRVRRPGGVLAFADIANGRPVPAEALRDIDLWTG